MGNWLILALLVAHPAAALTVVIDPGHGGSNCGAVGPGPQKPIEKRVTLAVAQALRRELERRGAHVVMTRERDAYLTLGERVRRANGARADLFLSIHANASLDHSRRGVETFVASRELVDVRAATTARGAHDPAYAMALRAQVRFIAGESARLARAVQTRLAATRPGDRGVRQAPYDVLDGVQVPAVLVEVGFVDHASEGLELARREVQRAIARALADGVVDFSGEPAATVARR